MDDLISRQAAIDICRAPHMRNADCSDFEMAIMMLPPAKLSTNLAEVGTDCISRQQAIEAINHELRCGAVIDQCGLETAHDLIEELPPAQPEHIRGHWICDRSWSEGVGMGESYGHYWKCDKCGHLEQGDWGECGCNFCSNCGSDNREVTE